MRIPLTNITQEMIDKYNLNNIVTHQGWIYMKIQKTLYDLKQPGALAANNLTADYKPYGYYKVPKTNGLWRHESCPITFILVGNNFGVKYVDRADA